MYFDTHAHYDDEQFDLDRDEVLASMPESGVSLIVCPASNLKSCRMVLDMAGKYPYVYAAVGVHPHDAKEMDDSSIDLIRDMAKNKKVVAIGEIGLDYHYNLSPRDIQKKRFYQQLELARELDLPVIIHEREACQDCMEIITQFKDLKGVVHCYSGSWETAVQILNMGWYISFTGAVTFKNAKKAPEVVSKMPLDRLMLETDSPYMAPVPLRGRRNDSRNLPYIAETIARLRGMTPREVAAITMENGKKFFGIK
ncbi:MAG: TatD family deoxyribonuclease [Ruminococcaceae bacterium]|nr:TatD family deoxyribonuclease [Oscillospiraceae bacterium]